MKRAVLPVVAVLLAAAAGVGAGTSPGVQADTPPGPHSAAEAAAAGRAAGAQQSNAVGATRPPAGDGRTFAAAPGSGAHIGGFISLHVYATQYVPHTNGSVEVAVPDKCVKFAALGDSATLSSFHCGPGYPINGPDYRVFVSSDDTGRNSYIPVKDTGPWNIDDNYWDTAAGKRPRRMFSDLPQGTPESQAAFYNGYNSVANCKDLNGNPTSRTAGADQYGRCVLNPSAIDLSTAAASQLGMTGSGWVTVTYLWEPLAPGYTLDGWGGVHPYGGAPDVSISGYWPHWDIARGLVTRNDHASGYVLDGWGGVHPFGGAPNVSISGYWPHWDIARGIARDPAGSGTSGYVVDGWGGVHPFGGAPDVTVSAYWPNWNIARGIVVNPRTQNSNYLSGYVLDGWGGVHPFWENGSPPIPTPSVSAYWQGWDITRGITNNGFGSGWVVDGWGGVHPFGGAPDLGGSGYWKGWDIVRGISFVFSLQSGYYADGWGGVHPFGAGAPVPDVSGYWPHWDIVRGVSGGP